MKRILPHLVLLLCVLPLPSWASASLSCGTIFLNEISKLDIDQTVLSLSRLRIELDSIRVSGRRSPHTQTLEADYSRQFHELLEYLRDHPQNNRLVSEADIKTRIRDTIISIQKHDVVITKEGDEQNRRQREATELLAADGSQLLFGQVEPGSFFINGEHDQKERQEKRVDITEPFAMSATHTTQVVWRKIVETAQSRFPVEFGTPTASLDSQIKSQKFARLRADPLTRFGLPRKGDLNPIEMVSHSQVNLWFEALNELARIDDPVVREMIPGHQPGDTYRLPTEAEWEYVATNVRTASGRNLLDLATQAEVDAEAANELSTCAWFAERGIKAHAVAEKEPVFFGRAIFFDIIGNLSELVADAQASHRPAGKDPLAVGDDNSEYIYRGGSSAEPSSKLYARGSVAPNDVVQKLGFRVVRVRQ